ncbi:hypothetical protein YC2023_067091 [Brassica napus]
MVIMKQGVTRRFVGTLSRFLDSFPSNSYKRLAVVLPRWRCDCSDSGRQETLNMVATRWVWTCSSSTLRLFLSSDSSYLETDSDKNWHGSRVVLTAARYGGKVGARGTAENKSRIGGRGNLSTPGSASSRSQSQPAQLRKYKSSIPPATALPPKANEVFLLPSKSRKPGGLHSEDGEVENNESFPSIHVNEEDLKRLKDFRLLETCSWSLPFFLVKSNLRDILKEFMENI